ncbi:MAG: Nif3-like dinuclear metal center hexameric protein [Clostridiales bacterium]|nr:Nif3-like dinuclear metal center hexameric protein [Clostridiales bacterium]
MPKIKDIISAMEEVAPKRAALEWDNPGLMTGDPEAEVKKAVVALDVEDEVITEAINLGANLIITHHPLIFSPVKAVTPETRAGKLLLRLIENRIAVFSAHTNLDVSPIGTNAYLAELLELEDIEFLMPSQDGVYAMGRVSSLKQRTKTEDFAEFVKNKLNLSNMVYIKSTEYVTKIGLCTGHGCDREFLEAAKAKGCDGYVTGDVSYHEAQEACHLGISLFDGTHYGTEAIVAPNVVSYLKSKFSDLDIQATKTNCQTHKII